MKTTRIIGSSTKLMHLLLALAAGVAAAACGVSPGRPAAPASAPAAAASEAASPAIPAAPAPESEAAAAVTKKAIAVCLDHFPAALASDAPAYCACNVGVRVKLLGPATLEADPHARASKTVRGDTVEAAVLEQCMGTLGDKSVRAVLADDCTKKANFSTPSYCACKVDRIMDAMRATHEPILTGLFLTPQARAAEADASRVCADRVTRADVRDFFFQDCRRGDSQREPRCGCVADAISAAVPAREMAARGKSHYGYEKAELAVRECK